LKTSVAGYAARRRRIKSDFVADDNSIRVDTFLPFHTTKTKTRLELCGGNFLRVGTGYMHFNQMANDKTMPHASFVNMPSSAHSILEHLRFSKA
jgi:hypothetical protein